MWRSLPRFMKVTGLAFACSAALLVPGRSHACGNAVSLEDERVSTVIAADKWLREGRLKASAELMLQHYPTMLEIATKDKVILRARRIVAVSVVRTEGLLPIPAFQAKTNDDRRKNLEWAVKVLRESDAAAPGTPVIQASLAEALATLPEHQPEAFGILERLAKGDVLPSAHGYRALARLRRIVGDEDGRKVALEKAAVLVASPPPPEAPPAPPPGSLRQFRFKNY